MVTNAGQCHYAAVDRPSGGSAKFNTSKKENPFDIKKYEALRSLRGAALV